MLPKPTDNSFPEALKAAREAKKLSFKQLAELVCISQVMPSRYENRDHSNFGPPSEKTWKKLDAVLSDDQADEFSSPTSSAILKNFSVEEIIIELKSRGAKTVQIEF